MSAEMTTVAEHTQLPLSAAVIEILEYLLTLNPDVQCGIRNHQRHCLTLSIGTGKQSVYHKDGIFLYNVKVSHRNPQKLFDVDGFLSSKVPDVLRLIPLETHRKGDPGSTQGFLINRPHKDNAGQPEQHCVTIDQCSRVRTVRSNLPTAENSSALKEVSVVLQVLQSKKHVEDEIHTIYQYLYKLRIINLQLGLTLNVNTNGEECNYNFGADLHVYKYHAGDVKILTNLQHYLSGTSHLDHAVKIKPNIGSKFIISSPCLWDDTQLPLKLSVMASIVPPPTADFLNGQCKELQISLFGPGNIPLHIAGKTQFPVDPVQLICWQDYGLTLGDAAGDDALSASSNSQGVFEADKRYQLTTEQEEYANNASFTQKYMLQLFIVLTRNDKTRPLVYHESQDLLQGLRSNMTELFTHHHDKLCAATATAVNKVLKCHPTAASNELANRTRENSVGHAITSINQAISTIVSHSVHNDFRQKCFNHLQVTNSVELSKVVTSRLWSIAKSKFGVPVPEEYQESQSSQESMPRTVQESQSYEFSMNKTGTWLDPHSQWLDNDDSADEAEFANLDVFSDNDDEQCNLESIQNQSLTKLSNKNNDEYDDGSGTQDHHESLQPEKIMKTAMGEDWFEEVLLDSDWLNES